MEKYQYITLREKPELMDKAAAWFNSKWGVPKEAYLECLSLIHISEPTRPY